MINRFKAIISNRRIYKEIELTNDVSRIKVGTTKHCDVRLNKKQFFSDFEMTFEKNKEQWCINCYGNVYCSVDGVMKMASKTLKHGDRLAIKYQNINQVVFVLDFMIDFESMSKNYDRQIDISKELQLTLGADNRCNIVLKDTMLAGDVITIKYTNGSYYLIDNDSKYGVYVNGIRANNITELKDYDFFSIVGFSFYYKQGRLYTSKESLIDFKNLRYLDIENSKSSFLYPKFNRNTRVISIIPNDKIQVLDPPAKPAEPKKNILATILPTIITGVLVLSLRKQFMNYSNNGFLIISACTMVIGVVTSIFNYFNGTKQYKKNIKERIEKYTKYIEDKKVEVAQACEKELELMKNQYYDLEKDIKLVEDFSGDLFDRRKDDEDFLDVYLGIGDVEAKKGVDFKEKEQFETEDDLLELPKKLYEEYKYIKNAPIVLSLKECNVVGVIGEQKQLYETLKNMTLDICVRQYYNDIKLFFIVNEEQIKLIQWVKFLPHIQNNDLNMRNIASSDESKNVIFEYLYNEIEKRRYAGDEFDKTQHFVIFVFDDRGIKNHPLSRFMKDAKKYNVSFIFFEIYKEGLPQYCDDIIYLEKENKATLIHSNNAERKYAYTFKNVDDYKAKMVAYKLAPVFCEEISLEGTLTKSISLFELLNIYNAEDLDLNERWGSSIVYKSMAAPLGVRANNDIVYLDIHEKAHGPHGLVAGTTGSGKSEILQSYVLSLATLFHPYEVCFVIIDFKGGGMANQFKDLPHLIGAITNIDGKQIDRSLLSIRAELNKRQQYFAKAEVNHIDQYIKKYKNGEVSIPLPHLIIIVDEFAELKANHPDFMKELISTARIGRSLGVHMILATQKPSGQVNEQIWSNSKFKLCLKVQNAGDSKEVIKSPLAAEIIEPGRAYFQVGNNEIFELFQSAYSGCSAKVDSDGKGFKDYYIAAVDFFGRRKVIFEQKKKKQEEKTAATQLEAITEYIREFCEYNKIIKLNEICLPALENKIEMPSVESLIRRDTSMTIELGLYDAPEQQYQGRATYQLAEENMMIIGSPRMGKTSVIQEIIKCATLKYTPHELNIYIFDFASMFLKNYESLNHVSGVACMYESDKLDTMMRMINEELVSRRKKMSEAGVSSISSYREASGKDCPQILLIIDNITVLKEFEPEREDNIIMLSREGSSVGISIIIANTQLKGIGYKYLANFSKRIALYCNDTDIYRNLFERCKLEPEELQGRCIVDMDKEKYECQIYQAFEGEKEIDRINELKKYIDMINNKYEGIYARKILTMPIVLDKKYIFEKTAKENIKENDIVIGMDYKELKPIIMNINTIGRFGILAVNKKDRKNFLNYFMSELDKEFRKKVELIIYDSIEKEFEYMKNSSILSMYSILEDSIGETLHQVRNILKERYMMLERGEVLDDEKTIGIVLNNTNLIQKISKDAKLLEMYKDITEKYKELKVFVIYANLDNTYISFTSSELLKKVKEETNILYFGNINEMKMIDMPITVSKKFNKELQTSDAYYLKGKTISRIKTVIESKKV